MTNHTDLPPPALQLPPSTQVREALDRMDNLLDPANGLLTVGGDSATVTASRRDLALIRAALGMEAAPVIEGENPCTTPTRATPSFSGSVSTVSGDTLACQGSGGGMGAQSVLDALEEARGVLGSINRTRSQQLVVDGGPAFWQLKSWTDWAHDEVLPQVTAAIATQKALIAAHAKPDAALLAALPALPAPDAYLCWLGPNDPSHPDYDRDFRRAQYSPIDPRAYEHREPIYTERTVLANRASDAPLLALIEATGKVTLSRCRVGTVDGPLRWDIEFGHHDEEVRAPTLVAAMNKAIARQAKLAAKKSAEAAKKRA